MTLRSPEEFSRLRFYLRILYPYLFAFAAIAFLIYAGLAKINQSYDGITWSLLTGEVWEVESSSPALGQLHAGDIILTVDGIPAAEATGVYFAKKPGDEITFTYVSDSRLHEATFTLARAPTEEVVIRLSPLGVGLAFWTIGVIICAFAPGTLRTTIFFGLCLLVACTLASGSLSARGPGWASSVFNVCLWWIGPIALHLHLLLPEETPSKGWLTLLKGSYVLSLLGSMPFLIWSIETVRASSWNETLFVAGRMQLAATLLVVVIFLIVSYIRTREHQTRRRIRIITFFVALALLLVTMLMILPGIILDKPFIQYELGFLFLLLIPASYGYAVYRHRLFRLERFLSRGAASFLVLLVIIGLYVAIVGLWNSIYSTNGASNPLRTLLITLFLAAIFHPLRVRVQRLVDWVFYGGWYNYHSAIEKLTADLNQFSDLDALGEYLSVEIHETLKLQSALVLLSTIHGDARVYPSHAALAIELQLQAESLSSTILNPSGMLSRYLIEHQEFARASSMKIALQRANADHDTIAQLEVLNESMLYPIIGDGALLGVFALGLKQGGEILNGEDQQIMQILSRQAGIAIENIHLLSTLRERAREIDQLHGRILLAREEERKQISRELHDEIIQDLIGINFTLNRLETPLAAALRNDIRETITDLRSICTRLRPAALDNLGILAAIRSRMREIHRREKDPPEIHLEVIGDEPDQISEEISITLYRFFNEAMSNVLKHASASQVFIIIEFSDQQIRLRVQDDGCGFTVPQNLGSLLAQQHFGLVGLRERVDQVSGSYSIQSSPNQGTAIQAIIPLCEPLGYTHSQRDNQG